MSTPETTWQLLRPTQEQRVVLIVCVFIAGAMCVFPPYSRHRPLSSTNRTLYAETFMGYRPLFAPPESTEFRDRIFVDTQRLGLQFLGMFLLGGAAYLLTPMVTDQLRAGAKKTVERVSRIDAKPEIPRSQDAGDPPIPTMRQPIAFNCPRCNAPYTVPAENTGRKGKCRKCGSLFTVPHTKGLGAVSSAKGPWQAWFAAIKSRENALRTVKNTSVIFFVVAGFQAVLSLVLGFLVLVDACLMAVGGYFLRQHNSRTAAVFLLILSIFAVGATFANAAGEGTGGGRNIVMAAIVFFAAVRAVEATFKLHGRFAATPSEQPPSQVLAASGISGGPSLPLTSVPKNESITFDCPACGHPYKVPIKFAGQAGNCRECGVRFVVPDSSQER